VIGVVLRLPEEELDERMKVAKIAVGIGIVSVFGGLAPSANARPKPMVTVVGDSITYLARSDIAASLEDAGYRQWVWGNPGTSIPNEIATVHNLRTGPRHPWVIELGTNDARLGDSKWRTYFDEVVRDVARQTCVVLVTVNPRLGPISVAIDNTISSTVATHRRFYSLDWGNIEWQNASWVQSDGVHPTSAGDTELSQIEAQAVETDCT
jgi:hypothetical protein